ncbi:MAG TPA: hypothetical protein VFL54_07745 [Gammaproteobacteria bacterium]|nr:hypothetical protein [Gammaproteobacteria bacterium]
MTNRPLLLDVGRLTCACTDHVLDSMYKALADPPNDSALWIEHHNPYLREHLEDVTRRGLAILSRIQSAIASLLAGKPEDVFGKTGTLQKALGWTRFTADEMAEIRRRLEAKPPERYTIDDWMMAVDWIVNRYLPDDVIRSEAEYLALRAQILGKIEAAMPPAASPEQVQAVTHDLPAFQSAAMPFTFTDREQAVLDFARARAAQLIVDIGDRTRARINHIILTHEQGRLLNDPAASMWALQSKLSDEFSVLNRDWRRVAVTEVARDSNEGFIASLAPGTRVKRFEAYAGACAFCRKIDGMVFTVVDPADPDKEAWKDIWVGKTNVDRSASPRKRVGDELVERTPEEMWWPAAGTQHPNCRGGWSVVSERPADVDPDFADWLDKEMSQIGKKS